VLPVAGDERKSSHFTQQLFTAISFPALTALNFSQNALGQPCAQAANQAPDFSQRIRVGLPNPPKLALR
jgi:hypothetical protein